MPAASDRNLLFGILALQMDFTSRDQLIAAMNAWVLDKSRSLGTILVEQKALDANRRALLEALVQEHLKQHDDDPQKSLAALGPIPSLRQKLEQVADADIHASLGQVPVAAADDPFATRSYSVGTPTSSGLRFRILRPHARGGLGQVYVAHDEELHREVALKEIQGRHADHAESRTRFLLEAEITGGLEHPGIVPVYGLGQYADGRPFYAMRFIRGDSLKDAIDRYHRAEREAQSAERALQAVGASRSALGAPRTLEFRQLLRRFIDVCNAIAYAHSRGVLHRDLKPGNIMLGKYGETLVVDWGLAKSGVRGQESGISKEIDEQSLRPSSVSGSAETQAGSAIGTPQFMSPEQAQGRLDLLGPASDVYSLGATLYCLLTGKPAFVDQEVGTILQKVQRSDFPRPCQLKQDVPPPLEAVCLKAMALKPAQRYCSPRDLADDIEHWLADEPVQAYPEPRRARLARWARRHKPLMAGAAALLFTAVIALSLGLVLLGQANTEIREAKQQAEKRGDDLAALNDTLLRANYIADMNLARVAWDENNLARGRELLDKYRTHPTSNKDLRGFEWHYLHRLLHGQELLVKAHVGWISAVAFTPDGKRLISSGATAPHTAFQFYSGDTKGEVKQWDAATGQPLPFQLKGQTGRTDTLTVFGDFVERIALSRDGTRMGVSCQDHVIRVWEFATGKLTLLEGPAKHIAAGIRFSPDGRCLISLYRPNDFPTDSRISIRIWDLATRKAMVALNQLPHLMQEASFSPDGRHFAVCGGKLGVVKVSPFNIADGQFPGKNRLFR
jgi:serine/threonine protein kinase